MKNIKFVISAYTECFFIAYVYVYPYAFGILNNK